MPKVEVENLSLCNIGGGAAVELFDEELKKVLENVLDCNTKAKAQREITLKVVIVPTDQRDNSAITVSCSSKLQPLNSFNTQAFISLTPDGPVAIEPRRPQQPLPFSEGVYPLKDMREKGQAE